MLCYGYEYATLLWLLISGGEVCVMAAQAKPEYLLQLEMKEVDVKYVTGS